ncbi:MAG: VanZ family protein [Gammaproteobacteria bacterium]|nr:VanZ family protein [Gammaproteobacteria bacterium]
MIVARPRHRAMLPALNADSNPDNVAALRYQHFVQRALLAYVVIVILLLTLSPFRFASPPPWRISWLGTEDTPANFLLFLPVGFFFRLALPPHVRGGLLATLLLGTAFSAAIEITQLWLPARLTSLFDVIANGLGALAGAIFCVAVRRRLHRTLPQVLTLELPMLNVFYLSLPLMWLGGLGIEDGSPRAWLLAPLGALGALIISGLWRHRFHAAAHMPRFVVVLVTAAWFVFGGFVIMQRAPEIVAQCALVVLLVTCVGLYRPAHAAFAERRFERRLLLAVWPVAVLYALMVVAWPLPDTLLPPDFALGYPEYWFRREHTFRIAEQLGTLTLLGYLVGESFGRFPQARKRTYLITFALALLLELVHGFLPGDRASALRAVLGMIAGGFGCQLYAAQLNLIRVLNDQHEG